VYDYIILYHIYWSCKTQRGWLTWKKKKVASKITIPTTQGPSCWSHRFCCRNHWRTWSVGAGYSSR